MEPIIVVITAPNSETMMCEVAIKLSEVGSITFIGYFHVSQLASLSKPDGFIQFPMTVPIPK